MTELPDTNRLLLQVPLAPALGHRFQPTGFPDVGAATYQGPDGSSMLLVESPQSMANRLEGVCFDPVARTLAKPLDGLPFVEVETSRGPTSSLEEAHRLNSIYIVKAESFFDDFAQALGYTRKGKNFKASQAPGLQKLASEVFRVDPNSIVHGLFLEKIAGTLRLQRLLSSFIEATGVREVVFGGVKNDRLDASGKDSGGSKQGYGNVPYHRTEYTAQTVTAFFNVDLALLRSYRLPTEAEQLTYLLCLWKIRHLLDGDLRLRTACDLVTDGPIEARRPAGWSLPSAEVLDDEIAKAIQTARGAGLLGEHVKTESAA